MKKSRNVRNTTHEMIDEMWGKGTIMAELHHRVLYDIQEVLQPELSKDPEAEEVQS